MKDFVAQELLVLGFKADDPSGYSYTKKLPARIDQQPHLYAYEYGGKLILKQYTRIADRGESTGWFTGSRTEENTVFEGIIKSQTFIVLLLQAIGWKAYSPDDTH